MPSVEEKNPSFQKELGFALRKLFCLFLLETINFTESIENARKRAICFANYKLFKKSQMLTTVRE